MKLDPSAGAGAAVPFLSWLEAETTRELRAAYGDDEATRAATAQFVGRAIGAKVPDAVVMQVFVACVVGAGYREADEDTAFAMLETLGAAARAGGPRPV